MKASVVSLLALSVLIIILVSLAYTGGAEGFTSYGETNERGTFVMYYADWCPHCKNVKPLFKDFMGTGIVKVNGLPVKVKMVEEKEIQKGVDPEIRGFPSFLYSDAAGKTVEFEGPRTPDGFMQFLKTQILS
jgi:thiol-disulfide isomerase/thioredoxin